MDPWLPHVLIPCVIVFWLATGTYLSPLPVVKVHYQRWLDRMMLDKISNLMLNISSASFFTSSGVSGFGCGAFFFRTTHASRYEESWSRRILVQYEQSKSRHFTFSSRILAINSFAANFSPKHMKKCFHLLIQIPNINRSPRVTSSLKTASFFK